MKIRDILRDKGFEVIAIDSSVTVNVAVSKLVQRNIGAVLVVEEGKPIGLFTERDALKCWIKKGENACDQLPIKEAMTKDIFIATPDDDINYAMSIMIEKNIRHLPVVDRAQVVSMLSIRDIVKSQVMTLETEIHYLKDYIVGGYNTV